MTATARERAPLVPNRATAVAALAGVGGVACALATREPLHSALAGAAGATLVWLAALDVQFRLLPNRIVLPGAALLLGGRALVEFSDRVLHPRDAAEQGNVIGDTSLHGRLQ